MIKLTYIQLKKVSKIFGNTTIFQNINLEIMKGRCVAIKGKSGIGKSTFLNSLAGLESFSSGEYLLEKVQMHTKSMDELSQIRREHMGYIPQNCSVIPQLTAFENICVPLWSYTDRKGTPSFLKEATELIELFGLGHVMHKKIEKLSGGEVQRVNIIRSLIKKPNLLVADEPTGALDDDTEKSVITYFQSLKSKGVTIVIATHSEEVARHCDDAYELQSNSLSKIHTLKC
jgi:ABC-type lipoprotein export system ATPase subunit